MKELLKMMRTRDDALIRAIINHFKKWEFISREEFNLLYSNSQICKGCGEDVTQCKCK